MIDASGRGGAVFYYPCWIQRMSSRNRNNQVKLSERYYMDYMGASQFETGAMGRSIRRMNGNTEIGTFVIDGITIYACWDKSHYNAAGVKEVLEMLYFEQVYLQERSEFNGRNYQKWKALEKNRTALKAEGMTNAWFDIEGGLFWTWEKINLKDIPLNIAKSVAWMDLTPEQQREAANPKGIHPTLGGKFGHLRDQLKSRD